MPRNNDELVSVSISIENIRVQFIKGWVRTMVLTVQSYYPSISTAWELVRNRILRPHLPPADSETGSGAQ